MHSELLDSLYEKYHIANLKFGTIHDKLGDLYEEYCTIILQDSRYLDWLKQEKECTSIEFEVFKKLLFINSIDNVADIERIEATNKIPHRETNGLSKTDIIMTIYYVNGQHKIYPISCKQTTVPKMAFAEFDVETICKEVNITDERLKELMLKHQTEKSAKYFTKEEKDELRTLLAPIAKDLVRWVITGNPKQNPIEPVFPTSIIKFKLQKPKDKYNIKICQGDFELKEVVVHTVEEYIDNLMYTKKGTIKAGGFGTGLSWTYATGSGGLKIQFKA